MKMKKLTAMFCILTIIACLFAGCGNNETATSDATPTPDATETPVATPTQTPKPTKKPETPIPSPDAWEYEYWVISEEDKTACLSTIIVPDDINTKKVTELIFPSEIDGYKITMIGWDVLAKMHVGGFKDDYNCWVQKVTIPATVTSFQDNVFRIGQRITEVIFEDASNITRIDDYAFRRSTWEMLDALANGGFCIVNNIICGIYTDGDVVIPDGVTMITGRPFLDTGYGAGVTTITIPRSVTTINNPTKFFEDVAEDAVIKCYAGSYAEQFAKDNNYVYEIIQEG